MAGTIFSARLENRTRAVENLAEQWKQDHDDAMVACDVQELVAEFLDQYSFLRGMWEHAMQCAVEEDEMPHDQIGRILLQTFDRSILAFEQVEQAVDYATRSLHHEINRESEFRRALIETKKMRTRIKQSWPFTDTEGIDDALRAFRAGRSRNVQDIINDLQRRNS